MKISVEISLYALKENYKEIVTDFLTTLSSEFGFRTYYTPMSSTLIGDYDTIFEILERDLRPIFDKAKVVFVMKISNSYVDDFTEIEEN